MLMAQAHTLDAIFNNLMRRASGYMGQNSDAVERYMKFGLRAQSQCRATLETLAYIKNPPMVIARQANLTTAPQQVNNGFATSTRTREIQSEQSKLLEQTHVRLDTGMTGQTIGTDTQLEAVGAVHGTKDD